MKDELATLCSRADEHPNDVEAQISAAWACDSYGDEFDAIRYYDAAWALGVPADKRKRFMVGYGSTLRNVGRIGESIAVHHQAVDEFPGYAPHQAFLALALHADGQYDAAIAAALGALISAGINNLDGYDRALGYYRDTLDRSGDDLHSV